MTSSSSYIANVREDMDRDGGSMDEAVREYFDDLCTRERRRLKNAIVATRDDDAYLHAMHHLDLLDRLDDEYMLVKIEDYEFWQGLESRHIKDLLALVKEQEGSQA